ncbi:hypothetical protein NDI47_01350 [Microcoleus vaginatus GB1-A2]|uniref:hypothetical protein n=1 Tax=Microcoleus vaginatus TaxID=119532 RepID=UPI0032A95729
MWRSAIVLIILALVVGIVGAIALGAYRWHLGTQELPANLEAGRSPIKPLTFDAREIADLPQPVQRYFRVARKPKCDRPNSKTNIALIPSPHLLPVHPDKKHR